MNKRLELFCLSVNTLRVSQDGGKVRADTQRADVQLKQHVIRLQQDATIKSEDQILNRKTRIQEHLMPLRRAG